ncbi:MAG TPA: efflux RND transporter periplasmic adaptor subunit [Puia sp.]|nr:efflux RND transporter periplasmic adaptor subunit [Puia sp.]
MINHFNKTKYLLLLVSPIAFLWAACSSDKRSETISDNEAPVMVTVAKPSGNETGSIHFSGTVESSQTANISTRVMGYITKLNVKVGDHVNKGQLIATISNDDILAKRAQADAMISEAEAALKNAQKDYDRFTALYKQQSASAKELENVTLQYNSMKSKLETAKQMRNEINATLAYTNLTAPFPGTVTQKLADAGSMANPGMPIVTIEQSGTYQISASVPETEISSIKMNEPVTISIEAANKTFHGNITQINQSSAFTGGQYIIKASIPANEKQGLYAGMYATLSVNSPQKNTTVSNAVLVPVSAIVNKDQLTGLYTIGSNNKALLRWVRLGKTFGNEVEVLSGLQQNEQFISAAEGKLYNGAPVKIK